MTVTPQTNTTLKAIAEKLETNDNFCICGHINPDGDCLGSALALYWALKNMGKRVDVINADDVNLDAAFLGLPGAKDIILAKDYKNNPSVFVCVDVPSENRLGSQAFKVFERSDFHITIDHHAVPERMSDLSYTDPDSPSTTMLIWQLAAYLGEQTKTVATCAYAGLMTDTGGFKYQNTNAEAFIAAASMVAAGANPAEAARELLQNRSLASIKLEALVIDRMQFFAEGKAVVSYVTGQDLEEFGATKSDTEPLIGVLRSLRGIEVACILKDKDGEVRGSLRAKGDLDISGIARKFGGGGHKAAAGFTLVGSLYDALGQVKQEIIDVIDTSF